jgi:transposase-like protein
MQGHKVTDEMLNEIRTRRNKGESIISLAEEFGVHQTTLYQRLRGVKKTAGYKGKALIKKAKPKMMTMELTPAPKVDRVVVMLVEPAQLGRLLGDINANS